MGIERPSPVELEAASNFDLGGSAAAWLVEAGTVDLYAELRLGTDAARRGPVTWRDHLFSIEAGDLILRFPDAAHLRVVARGRGRAQLRPLDRDHWRARVDGTDTVDTWLENLFAELARLAPSVDFVDELLWPRTPTRIAAGQRVAAARGIVWVRFRDGCVALIDGVEIEAYGEDVLVPVSRRTWLTVRSPKTLKLEVLDAEDLRREADLLSCLERFQYTASQLLASSCEAAYRGEQKRLATKWALAKRDRSAILSRFSEVMDPRAAELAAATPLPAALLRIGEHLGVEVELEDDDEAPGKSIAARIEDVGRRSRLRPRQVVLRGSWWRQGTVPMLAFRREDGAPWVLLPGLNGRARLWRPGTPRSRTEKVTAARAAEIGAVAYSFSRVLPDRPLGPLDLVRLGVAVCRTNLLLVAVFGALGTAMGMLVPIATGLIIDVTIPAHQLPQLVAIALCLTVAAVAGFCFKVCQETAILRAEGKATEALQPALIDRLLRLPNTFFRRYSAGDLADRAQAIDHMESLVGGGTLSTLLAGVLSAFNFAIMFYLDPPTALVAAAVLALLLAVLAVTAARQKSLLKKVHALGGELASRVFQMVSGIKRIRLTGGEDRAFVHWGHQAMEYREAVVDHYNAEVAFGAFSRGYEVLSLAVIFGTLSVAGDSLTTGGFLAFVAAFTIAMSGFTEMSKKLLQLVELAPTYRRVEPLLKAVPEGEADKAHPGTLTGHLEINDLVFRYGEGRPAVLDGLSLSAQPGQYVAIVGPSGCGKSTLFRLILGFESPESGSIYFDGKSLAGLDLREVRHQIGVVLQDDQLMEATLYENIKGVSDITLEEAWNAARMGGIAEDIRAMPMGMRTVISAAGSDLSGGQVQRLLIARSLAAKPRLLLLDEATSALDNRTQATVIGNLERLRITRIAIAHRLSTVARADRIYVMDQGRIVASGTFDELMEGGGLFADLVKRQQIE